MGGGGGGAGTDDNIAICANVERTVLNEDTCFLSTVPTTCVAALGLGNNNDDDDDDDDDEEILILINHETICVFYDLSGGDRGRNTVHLYSMEGLRIEDDYLVSGPCKEGSLASRCVPVEDGECNDDYDNLDATTILLFETFLSSTLVGKEDENLYVLDVTLPPCWSCAKADKGSREYTICDNCDTTYWKNVHRDYHNVYDMTRWTKDHPGNSVNCNPICEFARGGYLTFVFPWWHKIDQWQQYKSTFTSVR